MAITNPSVIHLAVPVNQIDQIIGIHTGSFSIAAPTSISNFTNATDSFTTSFGDTCYFQGIFSTDGGSTWNDFGVYIPNLSSPGMPVLQTVTCQGYVTSGGVFVAVGSNWYDFVHSAGSAYTIQYKIVLFAKDTQGAITPIATNEILQYNTNYNFQKIDLSSSFANGSGTTTIAHNLGYVPKVRAWFIPSGSTQGSDGIYTVPASSMMTLDWFYAKTTVSVDSSNVYFGSVIDNTSSAVSGTVYYRVYLDS